MKMPRSRHNKPGSNDRYDAAADRRTTRSADGPRRGRHGFEAQRLEPRLLFAAGAVEVPIVNPGFETLFKPGSTTVTASLPANSRTAGFGAGAAVTDAGGAAASAAYADGTAGGAVDVPGWTVSPGATAGVENAPAIFPLKKDNFAYVRPNPVVGGDNPFITQTLAGFSLKPNTTYVLSYTAGIENQSQPDGGPIFSDVLVNGTPLQGVDGSSPSPFPGTFPRPYRTYVTGSNPPAGPVSIALGIDATINATEVGFDDVKLTEIPGTGGTPAKVPTVAVAANLSAPDVTTAGTTSVQVTATYAGAAGVATGSLFPGNIQVVGPDGSALNVTAVTSTPATGVAPVVTATYTVAAPFGTFTSADNGTYTVLEPGGNISDDDDNIANDATTTFTVNVAGGPVPGTADGTFVGGGAKRFGFTAAATAAQADGKVLVVGQQVNATTGTSRAVLERLNADGTPDSTFGTGGTVADSAASDEAFYGLAVQADGKIVAVGAADGAFLLARYDAKGAPDPGFGTGGRVTTPLDGSGAALGVAVDPATGNIVVAGTTNGRAAVARYTPGGAADTSFDNGKGFVLVTLPSTGAAPGAAAATPAATDVGLPGPLLSKVAIDAGGSIVAAGASGGSVVAARVTAAGLADPTFGAGGATPGAVVVAGLAVRTLAPDVEDPTEGLALQTVGGATKILVANRTADGHFGLARLNADGSPDTTFGAAGGAGWSPRASAATTTRTSSASRPTLRPVLPAARSSSPARPPRPPPPAAPPPIRWRGWRSRASTSTGRPT